MYSREAIQVIEHDTRGALSGVPEVVCVRLLGGFEVSVGARTLDEGEWRLRKAATLIKLLALAPQHRLHREWIMDLLWPELAPKAAANNLRYALHNARRTLQPASPDAFSILLLRSEQLALCPEGRLWVDVEAFEEASDVPRRARDPAAYEMAVGLYGGDLLPEDCYEEWAEGRREELRTTYLALLLELAMLHEERAELGSAVEALRRVIKSEPTHEGAHTGLMRLYTLSGQRQEALRQYERFREVLRRQLGIGPDAATRFLYEEILTGRFSSTHAPRKYRPGEEPPGDRQHNLPAAKTSFVGRERELIEIKRTLATTRLLTLTGAYGSGKTRLALEVAEDLAGAYPDGVWLTELGTLSEEALVPRAVVTALGVREQPGRPLVDALVDSLRGKKMLLILDNCEHLIHPVAHLVDSLLSSCPHLRVLATSREALGVAGEVKWLVYSLSSPNSQQLPTVENLAEFESVRLFLERARCHHPAFILTPRNVGAVAEICRRLEGNPLAIELAATWVGVLSVGEISRRLEDPLKLLTAGDRTASSRQQTLRRALDWSYELLSEAEQGLFNRLSVFEGGWTLEAAEAVGTDNGIDRDDVLDPLSRLVNKSLVVAEANGDGELRYRMPELARRYGLERLQASRKAGYIRWRHAAWFLELVEEAGLESRRSRREAWLEPLARERVNLRAALSWTLERGEVGLALRLSEALKECRHMGGRLSGGRRWLKTALVKGYAPQVSANARSDEEARAVGRVTKPEPADEHALSEERPASTPIPEEPPADRRPTLLTRREQEVAALVGRGLTNRRISAQLVLSEHTVAKHVRKILKKLGFHSRTQIAAWVAKRLPPSNPE